MSGRYCGCGGEEERHTSKSKVDLYRLPPCHTVLYRRADEPILKKPKPNVVGQGWMRTDDGVSEPVSFCETHWLIFWTMVIVKRKIMRRIKTKTNVILTISVDGILKIIILKPVSG